MHCTVRAGLGESSRVIVLETASLDGRPSLKSFFASGRLSARFPSCLRVSLTCSGHLSPMNKAEWFNEQRKNLKDGHISIVLDELRQHKTGLRRRVNR